MKPIDFARELREIANRFNREQAWRMGMIAFMAAIEIEQLTADLEEANAEIERLRREKRDEIVQGFSR